MTPLIILFVFVTPVRTVTNYSPVMNDVQSQLEAGHNYGMSVHECTHGINSRLRNLYKKPSFYVLQNRAVTMSEPCGTLASVASVVPRSLRGSDYRHYLVKAQTWWNEQPTYVFDEFVAYTNGSQARKETGKPKGDITIQRMAEFIPYSICVPWATKSKDPKMKAFLRWQIKRAMNLGAGKYLDMSGQDTSEFRTFTKGYFGTNWCKKVLGI